MGTIPHSCTFWLPQSTAIHMMLGDDRRISIEDPVEQVLKSMTLTEATQLILNTSTAMDKLYQQPLFDELAIVAKVEGKVYLVWYHGPREKLFPKVFARDTAALAAQARSSSAWAYNVGDFEFTTEGKGPQAEAGMVLGEGIILICTNTVHCMAEIAKDRLWIAAQRPFVEMSERFQVDPLRLSGPPTGPELTNPLKKHLKYERPESS